ncbi:HAMP domain-containing sensor histidine kinase [Paenibacillus qinlingensis]|uniref:Signal transduction histidine-protein kinase/phosphatase MprB n=1 Tax=Paenibacillus qinlingensis TaxID=1837343 RepID=A0ABU1P5G2_9BACL|nr:HAMP domain-containing sensor histidine kinase [Paenibacillus qinlingensis]MDR6554981.1 signal transduction histidine kinase [Paenibacillus qinlingensis]
MSMTSKKRLSLLQVWSRTYFVSLLVGIIVVGLLAVQWMEYTTRQNRIQTIQHITDRMAEQVVSDKGEFIPTNDIAVLLRNQQKDLEFKNPIKAHIKSADQRIVFPPPQEGGPQPGGPPGGPDGPGTPGDGGDPRKGPPRGEDGPRDLTGDPRRLGPPEEMLDGILPTTSSYKTKKDEAGMDIYMFSAPVTYKDTIVGAIYMSIHSEEVTEVKVDYGTLYMLLTGGALLGWFVIYMLTRRLIKPIKEVADAAEQLMQGNYDVTFKSNSKEQEVAQLIATFQEMSSRLKQLESLRTLLLAGVTHELKTPVASISGLLQAIQDKVVEGEESEEFIQLSLKEAQRMHHMVEDLLDFNGFATGALRTTNEQMELNAFVREVVYQWQIAQEEHQKLEIHIQSVRDSIQIKGDSGRIQQILINLLNNSLHAGASRGPLLLSLYDYNDTHIGIYVADQGKGIAVDEQPYIFERFYRGSVKKHKVRGLGLGLPYSLMLAQAQGGQLFLRESTEQGSIFALTLVKVTS